MKRVRRRASVAALLVLVAGMGCTAARRAEPTPSTSPHARNVVLFIGDGFGISAYTATRLWKVGATGKLAIDSLPATAICSTYSYQQVVTDSAPSATAILSGVKARNEVIGEGPDALPGSPADPSSGREGTPAKSILETAAERGLATGIVTTTRITHATPAAAYAHIRHRDREEEIAAQLIAPVFGNRPPDVLLGGGRRFFLPKGAADPEYDGQSGQRSDGRNLVRELEARGYIFVWNEAQLNAAIAARSPKILGLFEPDHMRFEVQRGEDAGGEPSLAHMTQSALEVLARRPEGYFLLVEGGRIDHGLHADNVELALADAAAFDDAVARALALTDAEDTLILVTADHSHGLTINGNEHPALGGREDGQEGPEDATVTRAQLLGTGGLDLDGKPFPALLFSTGPGAGASPQANADRPALVRLPYGLHAGEDVLVAARGPGSERVHGFITNTQIYEVMRGAYGFSTR